MNKVRTLIVELLSATLGRLLVFLLPKKVNRLRTQGITVLLSTNKLSIKERLMRRAILKKAKRNGNPEELGKLHQNYWVNKGNDFFSETEVELNKFRLPKCEFIFDILEEQLLKESNQFKTLVEIGTGNGTVLNYLSSKFSQIDRFIGIDLNVIQTNNNIKKYKENSRLEFIAEDVFDLVNDQGHDNTIFFTFHGVLEYFTEKKLQLFLEKINASGKVIFLAIEPVGINHDFSTNPYSQVYGHESSFSHNYPRLFKNAGFELWHYSKKKEDGHLHDLYFIGAKN